MPIKRPWELLFVDDEPDACRQVKEYLEGEELDDSCATFHVTTFTDFDEALDALELQHFDILILDVHVGSIDATDEGENEAGIRVLEAVKSKRFLPVVFYTNLPKNIEYLAVGVPIIQVVGKTGAHGGGNEGLLDTIKGILKTGVPSVNRMIIQHIQAEQRDYMWSFVAQNWEKFVDSPDRKALAYLLARRLAISLSGPGIMQLSRELGDPASLWSGGEKGHIHPLFYYLMPPVIEEPLAGDIYFGEIEGRRGFWVLLTPSCDMVNGKAEHVLMAQCDLLKDQKEFKDWSQAPSKTKLKSLVALIGNNRNIGHRQQPERYHFLPGAIEIPDLIVDFQKTKTLKLGEITTLDDHSGISSSDVDSWLFSIPDPNGPQLMNLADLSDTPEKIKNLERKASLDSPFAEALIARFSRYFGRLGTPDLDSDYILERLKPGSS